MIELTCYKCNELHIEQAKKIEKLEGQLKQIREVLVTTVGTAEICREIEGILDEEI